MDKDANTLKRDFSFRRLARDVGPVVAVFAVAVVAIIFPPEFRQQPPVGPNSTSELRIASTSGESAASRIASSESRGSAYERRESAADGLPSPASAEGVAPEPAPTLGETYYVAPEGSDANPGTASRPFRTITRGASILAPGDMLLVKNGTYGESLFNVIPSGQSWEKPITVRAYPDHRPVIRPNIGADRVLHFQHFKGQIVHHIIIDGFIIDGANVKVDTVKITRGAHHIRIRNCEIMNAPNQGVLVANGSDNNEFINCLVHDNGRTALHHNFYIQTANNLVDGCTIYNAPGIGITGHSGNPDTNVNNIYRNNTVYDCNRGIQALIGSGHQIYNNVVYSCLAGIYINGSTVRDVIVYNNTVYDNIEGIRIVQAIDNIFIKNNIAYGNRTHDIRNQKTGTVIEKNLTGIPLGDPLVERMNFVGDPQFADPARHNFRVRRGSPAIDAGLALGEVPSDHDRIPRPQGVQYDIGAYEYK